MRAAQSSARRRNPAPSHLHFASEICRDPLLKQELPLGRGDARIDVIAEALELYLTKRTWDLLDAWN